MSQADKKEAMPGDIRIISAKLSNFNGSDSIDIQPLIREFNLFESIAMPFVTANFVLEDAVGLTSVFPIVGQETILLSFKTPHPSFKKIIEMEFRVVAIHNFTRAKDRVAVYSLKCIVPSMIADTNTKVRKAYRSMPINEMVNAIANEYLGIESFEMSEPTEGPRTIVIPNMNPTQAINFLCREAKSSDLSKTASNYRFYQNCDGFFFRTIEDMIGPNLDTVHNDTYFTGATDIEAAQGFELFGRNVSVNANAKPIDFRRIVNFRFPTFIDNYFLLRHGGIESKARILDPLTSSYTEKTYRYSNDFEKFAKTSRRSLGDKTVLDESDLYSQDNEARVFFLLSNKSHNDGIEPNQKEDMLLEKIASEFLHENIVLEMTIHGDSDKRVGELIAIDFPEYGATDDIEKKHNRFISGEYLILSIRHIYNASGYATVMTCSKNAFEKDILEYRNPNR